MKRIFSLVLLFIAFVLKAQPPTRFYTKFGGSGIDIGYGVKPTLDRQYIVVGSTSSYGAGNTDVYLAKVDSMGVPIWGKTFGGFGNDVGRSIIQLPDSSYVLVGYTNSFGSGGYDAYVVRTDKTGTLMWQKTFGGLDWDFAYDLVYTADANIVFCGTTSSFGHGNMDGFAVKYDLAGTLIWQKFYGGVEDDELRSVITTTDNALATVGYNKSFGEINGNCYFLKINLNGDTLFTRNFGGPDKDMANDLVQKSSGDYVIGGAKTFSTGASVEAYMYCMNSNGNFVWDNHYTSSVDNDGFVSVANSNQLPLVTTFLRIMSFPSFKRQGEIFLAHPMGYAYKVNAFGGTQDEYCYSMESMADGGYVSIGTTESFGSINSDVFLIRQDSTIINYSSAVGMSKIQKNEEAFRCYFFENSFYLLAEDNEIDYLLVTDILGKTVAHVFDIKSDFKMDLTYLATGVYIVNVRSKDGRFYTHKIIRD